LASAALRVALTVLIYAQEAGEKRAIQAQKREEPAARTYAKGSMATPMLRANWQAVQRQQYF
jgi:hypothetical protein